MILKNIKVGQEVKNYKELCKLLEIEERTGGTGRKNQIEWISDYVKYKKKGHKFIIEDVYSDIEIVPMKGRGGDMSDNTHIEYIEKLILDMLVQNEKDGEIFLSKSKLFEALNMVNENYGYCSGKTLKTSKYMNIEHLDVDEWFKSTSGMLERSLNKALNRLESQSLVFWSKKITIKEVFPTTTSADVVSVIRTDSTGEETETFKAEIRSSDTRESIREATKEEVQFIIHTEKEVMEKMECDNKQSVVGQGMWREFQREVKRILLRDANIGQYWQSYQVIFNHKHVKQSADKLGQKLLPYHDRDEYKKLLNRAIQDNTNKNSKNRSELASKKIKALPSDDIDVLIRRSSKSYIDNSELLADSMINKDADNIKSYVKKINPHDEIPTIEK